MAGPPTKIPALEMSHPDGSLLNRIEMEAQIREKWVGHQPKRLRAINPYGLLSKIAMSTHTIIIIHWILDTMIHRGEITGEKLGIDLSSPGQYDDPEAFNQFKQRLLLAIEQGQALQPEKREGIDMNDMKLPPPPPSMPGGVPPNGQSGAPYTPPAAPAMPGAVPPQQQQASTPAPTAAAPVSTGGLFPKDDPGRPWGKPAPSANRSRRTKQEMGEDQLWEKMGSPTNIQFGTFEQVYGLSYEQAKKQKKLGPAGEFPDIAVASAPSGAPPSPQTQSQPQVPNMNQPPVPMPPGMQPPPAPGGYPPQGPPTGYPPQGAAPQAPPAPPAPQQAYQPPQPPQGMPPGIPQAHPHAPPVPPAPGMGGGVPPMPPQSAPQSFAPPPPQAGAPAPSAAPGVDLGPLMAVQQDILNRLASMEERQIAIDAAVALQLRNSYQVGGDYTCSSALTDILRPS